MKGKINNLDRPIVSNLFNRRCSVAPRGITWPHLVFLLVSATVHRRVGAQPSTELQNNTYGYLANFNSSMAIIIVFLVCAFFLMGFFSIYLRRFSDSQYAGAGASGLAAGRAFRRRQGLDPAVIDTFPIFVFSAVKDLNIGKGALECAVCLSEFEDSETLRLLPKCDHVFHPDCIDAWLASHVTCPVCRTKLSPESGNSVKAPATESTEELTREGSRPEVGELDDHDHNSVVIDVSERLLVKLPRSHSTGHSLIRLGECTERYTLRIPEEVRRQLAITSGISKLKRCSSYDVVFSRVGCSRNGYRSGSGEGSVEKTGADRQTGRFDPWFFSMTPPFISRGGPVKSPKPGSDGGAVYSKTALMSVSGPLDCRYIKAEKSEVSPSRLPV